MRAQFHMDNYFTLGPLVDALIPLVTAIICGLVLGMEREIHRHAAGLRTLTLISLGSCVFSMAGRWLSAFPVAGDSIVDPGRLASYVIAGVGFLGAGPIINRTVSTEGLTTAASIWATASIGVLAGLGFIQTAVVTTVLIFIVLWGMRFLPALFMDSKRRKGFVHLFAKNHLALTRACLLIEGSDLAHKKGIDISDDGWSITVQYQGDEIAILNMLEALGCIPGLQGASVEAATAKPLINEPPNQTTTTKNHT